MYRPPRKGPRRQKPQFASKMRLRVGDLVRVMAGKDRGKEGKITRVLRLQGKVVVEGLNIVIKHQKPRPQANATPTSQQQQSGRIEMSAPLFASKVRLVDPAGNNAVTRIGIKLDGEGNRIRYALKSGGVIENG